MNEGDYRDGHMDGYDEGYQEGLAEGEENGFRLGEEGIQNDIRAIIERYKKDPTGWSAEDFIRLLEGMNE